MESASPAFFEAALAEVPLGRVGVPADIAPTIVFLLLRRLGLLQRRRARHRRRSHRARLAQGHRGRDQAAAVRLGTLRRAQRSSTTTWRTCCRPRSAQVIELGLDRALEIGDQARHGEPVPFAEADLLLPYQPAAASATSSPSSRTSRGYAAPSTTRSVSRRRGTTPRRSTSPTRTPSTAPARRSRGPSRVAPSTSRWRSPASSARPCARRPEDEAAAAIFGYTILNDWSARDLQSREMQVGLGPAKGKDFATSLGPWIVTADELHFA